MGESEFFGVLAGQEVHKGFKSDSKGFLPACSVSFFVADGLLE